MRHTSKGLTVWNNSSDNFDHTALAANWDLIDSYWAGFDSNTQLPNRISTVTTFPSSPTAGQLVMPTVNIGNIPAYSLARYDGTQWLQVGDVTIQSTLPATPTSGQIVVLSTATTNFPAWSTVRYDGSAWNYVGVFGYVNTGTGSTHMQGARISGDVYIDTATRGLILVDRVTGAKTRIYLSNGSWGFEAVS